MALRNNRNNVRKRSDETTEQTTFRERFVKSTEQTTFCEIINKRVPAIYSEPIAQTYIHVPFQDPSLEDWRKHLIPRNLRAREYPFLIATRLQNKAGALISDRVVLSVYPNLIFKGEVLVDSNDAKVTKRYRIVKIALIEGRL